MVAERAHQRRRVGAQLLRVHRRLVLQQVRKVRPRALLAGVQQPGQRQVRVQAAQEAIDGRRPGAGIAIVVRRRAAAAAAAAQRHQGPAAAAVSAHRRQRRRRRRRVHADEGAARAIRRAGRRHRRRYVVAAVFERHALRVHRFPLLGEVIDTARAREDAIVRGGVVAAQTGEVHGVRVHVLGTGGQPFHLQRGEDALADVAAARADRDR